MVGRKFKAGLDFGQSNQAELFSALVELLQKVSVIDDS